MARITKPVEERRQEIIDTAKDLFLETGFDKTQVADISRKMNIAQGLIYHYFKSKTEILYAVIDAIAEQHVSEMEKLLSVSNGTTIECLNTLFKCKPEMGKSFFKSIMNDRGIAEYCGNKVTISTTPLLVSLIERGNADGSWHCEYPIETAAFILHGISGVFGLSPHNQDKPKQAIETIIRRVLGVQPGCADTAEIISKGDKLHA